MVAFEIKMCYIYVENMSENKHNADEPQWENIKQLVNRLKVLQDENIAQQ